MGYDDGGFEAVEPCKALLSIVEFHFWTSTKRVFLLCDVMLGKASQHSAKTLVHSVGCHRGHFLHQYNSVLVLTGSRHRVSLSFDQLPEPVSQCIGRAVSDLLLSIDPSLHFRIYSDEASD